MKSLRSTIGCKGAVYVEFLIVFFPMMLLWLGLAQIGLLYGAHILVHCSAARAVRAAVVILADDREGHESRYENVPAFQIGDGGEGLDTYKSAPEGGRLDAIRRAARIPLAPVSPSLGASDSGAIAEMLIGYLWTAFGVAVTFPDGEGDYLTKFENRTAPLTAKVTYLYRCPVPIANKLMCSSYFGMDSFLSEETMETLEQMGELAGIETAFESGIDPQAQKELNTVGGELLGLLSLGIDVGSNFQEMGIGGWRFCALTAEKSLPLQGRHE